ncbi:MAG: hypothetical protein Q8P40_13780 [Nitrospirota bacterium]|nr:hypothetical protein [Nitrospirota bacterium]
MNKECPNCKEMIEYLKVSRQIEGLQCLPDKHGVYDIAWKESEKHITTMGA